MPYIDRKEALADEGVTLEVGSVPQKGRVALVKILGDEGVRYVLADSFETAPSGQEGQNMTNVSVLEKAFHAAFKADSAERQLSPKSAAVGAGEGLITAASVLTLVMTIWPKNEAPQYLARAFISVSLWLLFAVFNATTLRQFLLPSRLNSPFKPTPQQRQIFRNLRTQSGQHFVLFSACCSALTQGMDGFFMGFYLARAHQFDSVVAVTAGVSFALVQFNYYMAFVVQTLWLQLQEQNLALQPLTEVAGPVGAYFRFADWAWCGVTCAHVSVVRVMRELYGPAIGMLHLMGLYTAFTALGGVSLPDHWAVAVTILRGGLLVLSPVIASAGAAFTTLYSIQRGMKSFNAARIGVIQQHNPIDNERDDASEPFKPKAEFNEACEVPASIKANSVVIRGLGKFFNGFAGMWACKAVTCSKAAQRRLSVVAYAGGLFTIYFFGLSKILTGKVVPFLLEPGMINERGLFWGHVGCAVLAVGFALGQGVARQSVVVEYNRLTQPKAAQACF